MQKKPRKKVAAKPSVAQTQSDEDFLQAVEQAKLAAMKELAYGASHEINNPLANISTRAQTLLKQEKDPEKRRMLASIHAQAMRAHEMIADLMLFARPPKLNLAPVDLGELLNRVVGEMQPLATAQRTELKLSIGSLKEPAIQADATQLAVALRALIQNSLEAMGAEGEIEVTLVDQEHEATITVGDTGPGIPVEVLRHIFEPFYSGRESGRGLGFGLAKCWRILTDHGGRIQVASSAAGSARFEVRLPHSQG